jgi:hypothetical protein
MVHSPVFNGAPDLDVPGGGHSFRTLISIWIRAERCVMHTDEYEISVGREINLCRKLIDKLAKKLREREKGYGMSTEDFLSAFREARLPASNRDFVSWAEDSQELKTWTQRLREYEEAFRMLKKI